MVSSILKPEGKYSSLALAQLFVHLLKVLMRLQHSTHQKQLRILLKISVVSILILSGLLIEQETKISLVLAQPTAGGDHKALADSLLKEGQRLWAEILQQGNQTVPTRLWAQEETAMKTLQKALTIYQRIGDARGQLNVLKSSFHDPKCHDLGDDFLKSEVCIRSRFEYYKLAIQIAEKLEDHKSKLDILYDSKLGSLKGFGGSLRSRAEFYLKARDNDKAAYYLKWEVEVQREILRAAEEKNPVDLFLISALINLGKAYNRAGNYGGAIDCYREVVAHPSISVSSTYNEELRKALNNAYFSLNEYRGYVTFFESRLTIEKKAMETETSDYINPSPVASALLHLANAYLGAENYERSIDYYRQVLDISTNYERRNTHNNIKSNANKKSSSSLIIKKSKAFSNVTKIELPYDSFTYTVAALNGLGMAHLKKKDTLKAAEYFQEILTSAATKNEFYEAERLALINLGRIYNMSNKQEQAIKYFQDALYVTRNKREGIYGRLESTFVIEEYSDPEDELAILIELSNAFASSKNLAKANEFYQQALLLSQTVKSSRFQGLALKGLGTISFQSGNLLEAEKLLRQAIAIQESLQAGLGARDSNKVQLFEEQNGIYRTLQQVLVAQNKFPEALEISERGRARAFAELLVSKRIKNPNAQPALKPLTFAQIQQIAQGQNATIVEYSIVSSDRLYIYVIKPAGKIEFQSVDLKSLNLSLEKLVSISRQSIGARGRGDSIELVASADVPNEGQHLRQLYDLLIQPIAVHLPANSTAHVIFIPQDELFLVPFAALQDPAGNYLIKDHTLLVAPSVQVLQLTHQQRQSMGNDNQTALVVGDPTMPKITVKVGTPPIQLPNLAGAKQEALEVAQLLRTKALTGNEATKAAVLPQLATARMVHLATHGLIDDFKGLGVPGAIALAPAGNGELNDGLLTANEILDMKLKAELVVLSACDTGRGRVTGDGVIGLSRSLIAAGVPSVLVSLWSVPDAPTAELMTTFYRSLQQQKNDKAQALRQAMLTTMNTHPNPKDWAAFTLIGEAE